MVGADPIELIKKFQVKKIPTHQGFVRDRDGVLKNGLGVCVCAVVGSLFAGLLGRGTGDIEQHKA